MKATILVRTILLAGVLATALPTFAQDAPAAEGSSLPRHAFAIHTPEFGRVRSFTASYQYTFLNDLLFVGAYGGIADTREQLRLFSRSYSGTEFGLSAGIGGPITDELYFGAYVRVGRLRSPFRIDGFVEDASGNFYRPVENVPGSFRRRTVEVGGQFRFYIPTKGPHLYVVTEAGLQTYGHGVFSDADLYPGFRAEEAFVFPDTIRLPQNEYHLGFGARARLGFGVAF